MPVIALPTTSPRLMPKLQDAASSAADTCTTEGATTCPSDNAVALDRLRDLYITINDRRKKLSGAIGEGPAKEQLKRAFGELIDNSCNANPLQATSLLEVYQRAYNYISTDRSTPSLGPSSRAAQLLQSEINWLQKTALPQEQQYLGRLDGHGKKLLADATIPVLETACSYQRVTIPSINSVHFSTGELRADTNNVDVIIVGAYFPADTRDTRVAFLDSHGVPDPKITINGPVTSSGARIDLNISVATAAESGPRTIRVYSEKYDAHFKDYSATFEVNLLSMERFFVNNDTAPTVYQGQAGVGLTITGKRFDKVETLAVDFFTGSPTELQMVEHTANQIATGPFTIPENTPPGQYRVNFYAAGGQPLSGYYLVNVRPRPVVDSFKPAVWREIIDPRFTLTSGISNHDQRLPYTTQALTDQTPTLGLDLGLDTNLVGLSDSILYFPALKLDLSLNGAMNWYAHLKEVDTHRWNAGGKIDFSVPATPYVEPGITLGYQHLNNNEASPLGLYPYFNGTDNRLEINPSVKRSWLGKLLTTRLYANYTGDWLAYAAESAHPAFDGKNNTWELGASAELDYHQSPKPWAPVIDFSLYAITGREQAPQNINGQAFDPANDPKHGWGSEIKAKLPNLALAPHLAAQYSRYTLESSSAVPLYNFKFNAGLRDPWAGAFDLDISTQRLEPIDQSRWTRLDVRYTLPRQAQFISFGAGYDSFYSQIPNALHQSTTTGQPFVDVSLDFMRLPFGFLGTPELTK